MRWNRIYLYGVAAIFLGFAMTFLAVPHYALALSVSAEITSVSAAIDMRATYGGLSLAVAALLYMMGREQRYHRLGLLSVMLLMVCMAFGRSIGFMVDGPGNYVMVMYLVLECAATLLTWLLYLRTPHEA